MHFQKCFFFLLEEERKTEASDMLLSSTYFIFLPRSAAKLICLWAFFKYLGKKKKKKFFFLARFGASLAQICKSLSLVVIPGFPAGAGENWGRGRPTSSAGHWDTPGLNPVIVTLASDLPSSYFSCLLLSHSQDTVAAFVPLFPAAAVFLNKLSSKWLCSDTFAPVKQSSVFGDAAHRHTSLTARLTMYLPRACCAWVVSCCTSRWIEQLWW